MVFFVAYVAERDKVFEVIAATLRQRNDMMDVELDINRSTASATMRIAAFYSFAYVSPVVRIWWIRCPRRVQPVWRPLIEL